MNVDDLRAQESILRDAGDRSPVATYAGLLTSRADELRTVLRDITEAELDGWRWDLVPAAALEPGVPVFTRSIGPAKVLRVVKNGMGVECETSEPGPDPIRWINPLAPSSPVVVLNGQAHQDPD